MTKAIDIIEGELPLTHTFSDGVYAREIFMPKGMVVIGHVHNTTHLNIVSTGKALVYMNDIVVEITAPFTFESKAGTRKVLYILEDMFWTTIHVTDEVDIETLKESLVDKKASSCLEVNIDKIKHSLLSYKKD
jgi:hypothetical protein